MAEDGVFLPEPNPYDRDVLMNIRRLPAAEGRPEGCYWTVSRGKVKALADCAAERTCSCCSFGTSFIFEASIFFIKNDLRDMIFIISKLQLPISNGMSKKLINYWKFHW